MYKKRAFLYISELNQTILSLKYVSEEHFYEDVLVRTNRHGAGFEEVLQKLIRLRDKIRAGNGVVYIPYYLEVLVAQQIKRMITDEF